MKPHLLFFLLFLLITFTTKTLSSTSPQSTFSVTQIYDQLLSQQKSPNNETIYKVSKQLCWGCIAESLEFLFKHNLVRATKWELPLMWDFQLEQYAKWWASQRKPDCKVEHSFPEDDFKLGENIFWGSGSTWTPTEKARQGIAHIILLFLSCFVSLFSIVSSLIMANNSARTENHDVVLDVTKDASKTGQGSDTYISVPFLQKLVAEMVGTYFLIFAGCASVVVNKSHDNVVTLPGIAIVWGLAVCVLVYSLGHISGAHFNPAVTIAFASTRRFPLLQVPAYISAQLLGATLASGTLKLTLNEGHAQFSGTLPNGTNLQAFVIEFIITFYLMFVISGVATDNRAIGELAGIAIGSTILLNVMISGPLTGASMNPVRSLGPAFVHSEYRGIWIYLLAPVLGAVAGAWVYNTVRYTDKPLREITQSASFLKETRRGG